MLGLINKKRKRGENGVSRTTEMWLLHSERTVKQFYSVSVRWYPSCTKFIIYNFAMSNFPQIIILLLWFSAGVLLYFYLIFLIFLFLFVFIVRAVERKIARKTNLLFCSFVFSNIYVRRSIAFQL